MSVTLGGVALTGWATPDKVPFGGKHKLNIHRMIGGQRVVDATGPDPSDITFSGRFRGPSAIAQAQALNAMSNAGAQVPLMWLGLFYMVVIEDFRAETEKAYEVPYTVTCVVVTDPGASVGGMISSMDSMVASDLTSASSLPSLPAIAATAIAGVSGAASVAGALQGASISTLAPVVAAATAASLTVNAGVASADPALLASSPDTADPTLMASWLTAASANSNAQAALVAASGYLGRVALNLTNGSP